MKEMNRGGRYYDHGTPGKCQTGRSARSRRDL